MPSTARTRRWWQFSLRTMLAATLILSVWLGVKANHAHRQRRAVEVIRDLGGTVVYDYQLVYRTMTLEGSPEAVTTVNTERQPKQTWLRQVLGDDWFDEVHYVTVRGEVMIAGARFARELPRGLESRGPALLEQVASLANLRRLVATDQLATDEALVHLRQLPRLKYLDLSFNQISDKGLAHLAGLTQLEGLDLSYLPVTDKGLVHLRRLTSLRFLNLTGTEISNAGLGHLRGLTSLTELHLSNTQVTDEGVEQLSRALPELVVHDD